MLWEISQNSQENICAGISFLVFSCEFCEIYKNTFFAEQHRTTASDYSRINSIKVVLANKTVNYDTKALRKKYPNSKSLYYGLNLRIQSEYRKIRTRKTPYFDTFRAVKLKHAVLLKIL